MATKLLDAKGLDEALQTLADDINKSHQCDSEPVLIGVQRRGVPLANRIADLLEKSRGMRPEVGTVDISLYRDDVSRMTKLPIVRPSQIPFDVTDRQVILIDDVIFSGRTVRAALDELLNFGRPEVIKLAVVVDRGHRQLPVQPDFYAVEHKTDLSERVYVRVKEVDDVDEVVVDIKPKEGNA